MRVDSRQLVTLDNQAVVTLVLVHDPIERSEVVLTWLTIVVLAHFKCEV